MIRAAKRAQNVKAGEPKGGLKPFLEAWAFFLLLGIVIIGGAALTSYLVQNQKEATDQVVEEEPAAVLATDIASYKGAAVTRYTKNGRTELFEFDIPQGSVASVHAYYDEDMAQKGWTRMAGGSETSTSYKKDKRTVTVMLKYVGGIVHSTVKIVTTA
jgi:hypothetical protein